MNSKRSFSKWGIVIVFLLYAELVGYGQVAMWHFGDLSSLNSLWLYAVPPILALLGYFLKAMRENTRGGIVYDAAMKSPQDAAEQQEADEQK